MGDLDRYGDGWEPWLKTGRDSCGWASIGQAHGWACYNEALSPIPGISGGDPSANWCVPTPEPLDCSAGTYSLLGGSCTDCSGITLKMDGFNLVYTVSGATLCSTTYFPKNSLKHCYNKYGHAMSISGNNYGHFCCVSGTDGLYSLDASSGKCDTPAAICRVEGTGVGGGGNCDVSGCHEKLMSASS
jgi:hypothetical protein